MTRRTTTWRVLLAIAACSLAAAVTSWVPGAGVAGASGSAGAPDRLGVSGRLLDQAVTGVVVRGSARADTKPSRRAGRTWSLALTVGLVLAALLASGAADGWARRLRRLLAATSALSRAPPAPVLVQR